MEMGKWEMENGKWEMEMGPQNSDQDWNWIEFNFHPFSLLSLSGTLV